jgi:hypothetical protein
MVKLRKQREGKDMKKIFFVVIGVLFVSSLCFIQQPVVNADETKTFTGKVESVTPTLGRPPLWTYAKIVVIADKGDKSIFFIKKATTLSDVKGNTNPPLPKKGESVEVKYSIITNGSMVTNGKNGAISIRYLD